MDSYDVDDECIAGNVFWVDVFVAAEKEDHFRRRGGWFEVKAKLKRVDLALVSVEHVVAVPAVFWVDELVAVG